MTGIYFSLRGRLAAVCAAIFTAVCAAGAAVVEKQGIDSAVDGVAASVNGVCITVAEVASNMRPEAAWDGDADSPEDMFRAMYDKALNDAIDRELIIEEYNSGDLRIPTEIMDRKIAEFAENSFGKDRSKLMEMLSGMRMTYDDWRETLRKKMIVSAMERVYVYDNIHVSVSDILKEYENNPDAYQEKSRTKVSVIAVDRTNDLAAVSAALAESAENFSDLARTYSVGSNSAGGGSLGWLVPSEDLNSKIAAALDNLAVGAAAGPIELSGKFYFVRKDDEKQAGKTSIAEVQEKIKRGITEREADRLRAKWIGKLRENAAIVIYSPFE